MKCINLIPAQRRQAKASRRRIVKWGVGLGLYCVVVLAGCLAYRQYAAADNRGIEGRASKADNHLKSAKSAMATLGVSAAKSRQELQTAQALAQQPDWSFLFDLMSRSLGENVVLQSCRLEPLGLSDKAAKTPDKTDKKTDSSPKSAKLDLAGIAKNQSDMSDYVLRLEKLGIFDKVRLIQTAPQTFLGAKAASFRLECVLAGGEGKTQ
jgi:Tfp pilus assembly protein PilN